MNKRIGFVLAFAGLAVLSTPTAYGQMLAEYRLCCYCCCRGAPEGETCPNVDAVTQEPDPPPEKGYPLGPKRVECLAHCSGHLGKQIVGPPAGGDPVPINLQLISDDIGTWQGIPVFSAPNKNASYTISAITNDASVPDSVSFWLVDDDHPDFDGVDFESDGNHFVLLGTDADPSGGWSVTFTPDDLVPGGGPAFSPGQWYGFIYARADIPGHGESDKDYFALPAGRFGVVPTVSEWGLIVMGLVILSAATVILYRRRRVTA